ARLARIAGGRLLTVVAGGSMQSVIGGEAAALFEGHSRLDVQALIGDDRRIDLRSAEFAATNLRAAASGTVTLAGAVESADIAVTLASRDGRFQFGAGRASLRSARVEATVGPDALAMR